MMSQSTHRRFFDPLVDMENHLWFMTLYENLFLAPIGENPQNCLDIGTGTGIWAMDFGSQFHTP